MNLQVRCGNKIAQFNTRQEKTHWSYCSVSKGLILPASFLISSSFSSCVSDAPTLVIGGKQDPATPFEAAELIAKRIPGAKLVALLSCGRTGHLDKAALPQFQVMASYHLSERGETPCASDTCELLSERERECLRWVSHGKTTDEVAGILEVSPNTVNSYVAHAVKKLSVRNRPMAIAALIRAGLI